ncbi:MAG: hypothetical protein HY273_11305 [Gammaproteobacteria bacterium]|nr:hypothetical protein [Gammaproteobacteria bacterium]
MLFIAQGLSSALCQAEESAPPLPESVPGITTINAENLASMLDGNTPPIVIDARTATGRRHGYIEGSLHLADVDTNCVSLAKVIRSRETAAVFYCTSSKCGRSLNALKIAQACAYRNIYWFRGGLEEWQNKGYPYVSANVPAR